MNAARGADPVTLAVETAGRVGSLYLSVGTGKGELLTLDPAGRRNARTIVPEAARLCGRRGLALADVGLVCVALGPGSFTGLRVGVTFAKTLAFAAGAAGGTCDAVGVPSHLAVRRLTQRADPPGTRLRVVSDALRGDVYLTEVTTARRGDVPAADGPRLIPADAVPAGDDLVQYGEGGGEADAGTVFIAGLERWRAGARDDPFALAPLYVRRSAAEETADGRDERGGRTDEPS